MYYDSKFGYNVGSLSGRAIKNSLRLGDKMASTIKKAFAKTSMRKADSKPYTLRRNGPSCIPSVKNRKFFNFRPPGAPR